MRKKTVDEMRLEKMSSGARYKRDPDGNIVELPPRPPRQTRSSAADLTEKLDDIKELINDGGDAIVDVLKSILENIQAISGESERQSDMLDRIEKAVYAVEMRIDRLKGN